MVQGYEQVTLDPAWARTPFRRRGVYLLTGGLGGIGLVMARHLARTVQARLVLVGRTALPERESWAGWLADHDPGDRTSTRIREVLALEEMGAEVLVIAADVSDRAAMERVLALADACFGELHGVFHGAGAIGMETFREVVQATTADSEAQFKSKVHGLLVLDQVLAGRNLDFCVLMSSLAAILGGLGFAAYSAANLFMDAFARSKNRAGGTRWTSIDWDSWRLPGANLAIAGLGATVNEFYMEADEGMAALERAVTNGTLDQVVVSTGDIDRRLRQWVIRDAAADSAPAAAMTIHRRPDLGSAFKAPNGQLELDLAEIWKELFNIDPIGVDDNFFELGGHSLLATQLNARISSRLHVDLSLATLLQAPTIAELSLSILAAQAAQADPETLERMLAEVGDMSPEELERLLSEETDTLAMAGDDE
jgi:NAD(P)-dependent dehydrogenase (short-subunit alcohol dehydrogenase family)/aryl carrier-like protein